MQMTGQPTMVVCPVQSFIAQIGIIDIWLCYSPVQFEKRVQIPRVWDEICRLLSARNRSATSSDLLATFKALPFWLSGALPVNIFCRVINEPKSFIFGTKIAQ